MIQNAFNSTGQDEAYTSLSPEYTMMESIGYNGVVPETSTWLMMLLGFAWLGLMGWRAQQKVSTANA